LLEENAMAEPKTQKTNASVTDFIDGVEHPKRREDSLAILELMREVTGQEPAMWGPSIVGFGTYRYKYASGREGEWPLTGFAPRKRNLTLYITPGFERYDALLAKLGRFKTGKSCLYVNKLEDVDLDTLRELVRQSVQHVQEAHTTE
jgi:hypothetical protein